MVLLDFKPVGPVALLALMGISDSPGADPTVGFTTTPQSVVEGMLDLAEVGSTDYVIDLGSGDGRIVIAAARRGALAHGVEIEPDLVALSREKAREAGVRERVRFLEQDFFQTDLRMASVVTLYVLESTNIRLKPLLLEQLAPGSRVVSHRYRMGEWLPDATREIDLRTIHQWIVPANFGGTWRWQGEEWNGTMEVRQRFQEAEILRFEVGQLELQVASARIRADGITIAAEDPESGARFVFQGLLVDDRIKGHGLQTTADRQIFSDWRPQRLPIER